MDELDEGNISAAAGKQEELWKAELSCATLRSKSSLIELNQIKMN